MLFLALFLAYLLSFLISVSGTEVKAVDAIGTKTTWTGLTGLIF
jgi:hypothetical protein